MTAISEPVAGLVEDHGNNDGLADDDFPEADVAEVLAATWKEKRAELNRLQKARQFGKTKEVRRSFGVEVEELDVETVRTGHVHAACLRIPAGGKPSTSSGSTGTSGAAMVIEHDDAKIDFVASVGCTPSMLDELRRRVGRESRTGDVHEVALVSSPGYV